MRRLCYTAIAMPYEPQ